MSCPSDNAGIIPSLSWRKKFNEMDCKILHLVEVRFIEHIVVLKSIFKQRNTKKLL